MHKLGFGAENSGLVQSLKKVPTSYKAYYYWNTYITPKSFEYYKVVVIFYLRLKNEFHSFPAKNQAYDWLANQMPVFWWDFSISDKR